jgi:hypothetical protein
MTVICNREHGGGMRFGSKVVLGFNTFTFLCRIRRHPFSKKKPHEMALFYPVVVPDEI